MASDKVEAGYLSEESDYASSDDDFDWTSEAGGDNNDTDMTDLSEGDEEEDVEEDEDGEWLYSDMEMEDMEDYLEDGAHEGYELNQHILRQMQEQSLAFESNSVDFTNLDIEVGSYADAMAGNAISLPESFQYYYDMYTGF